MLGPKFFTNKEIEQMELELNKKEEMRVINCTQYQADEINKIRECKKRPYNVARMDIVQIGTRADSDAYIRQKIVQGQKAGAMVVVHRFSFPEQLKLRTKIETIRNLIMDLNSNVAVDGIMVQLPMEDNEINKTIEREIIDYIDPLKDVDCLTTVNLGKLYSGFPLFTPCTPAGIMELFDNLNTFLEEDSDKYKNYLQGKKVLVIGRSHIVGKPLSYLLTDKNATVTLAHSYTPNLKEILWSYDVIITATGKKDLIDANDFRRLNELVNVTPKALIDVAINRDEEGICGDICRELYTNKELQKNIDFVTATPGGVGRMTVLSLIRNLYKAREEQERSYLG